MKLRSLFLSALCALTIGAGFTSCDDDDNSITRTEEVTVADGVFIVNEGSYFSNINGSLDYLDYATGNVSRNIFETKNGRTLGGTPNNALLINGKLYIATADENRIEVVDASSLTAGTPISVTTPRELATDGNYLYVSSYTGKVTKIDLQTNKVTATSEVIGTNLEGIAVLNGNVYVCNAWNSDYTYNENVVKLKAADLTKIKDITVVANPTAILTDGKDLYVQSMGNYYDITADVQKIDVSDKVTSIAPATMMAYGNGKLYLVNAPYGSTASYSVYDINTATTATFITGTEIFSPFAIAVDPVSEEVFISSYNESSDYPGSADYTGDGYIARYKNDGTFVNKYTVGLNPGTFVFVSHHTIQTITE